MLRLATTGSPIQLRVARSDYKHAYSPKSYIGLTKYMPPPYGGFIRKAGCADSVRTLMIEMSVSCNTPMI